MEAVRSKSAGSKWNGAKTTQNKRRLCKKSFLTSLFSATHFLKGPSCLNSPGTPQQLFVTLRRQPNSTEKSVNATISCAEQRPFKTPQLPALRAVVSEPAQQKRRFFLLLYFQRVGSPSIWGWKRAPAAVADFRTRARQGLQTCFGGHGCLPAPTRPTQRLTGPNGGIFPPSVRRPFSLSTAS